jgi:hypothetical protein
MGNSLSKASDSDGLEILGVWEEVTGSEFQQVSGMQVLI